MTHQLIYGINVYSETFYHTDRLNKTHIIPYQLTIGKNLEVDKFDCSLINYLCIEDFYLPGLRLFLLNSLNHFFTNNPNEIICFRLDLHYNRNILKLTKFLRFLDFHNQLFQSNFRVLSNRYAEITIKK